MDPNKHHSQNFPLVNTALAFAYMPRLTKLCCWYKALFNALNGPGYEAKQDYHIQSTYNVCSSDFYLILHVGYL